MDSELIIVSDPPPITGLDELDKHLDQLLEDPEVTFNEKIFDEVGIQINKLNVAPLIGKLLPRIVGILTKTTHDPTIPSLFARKLVAPLSFSQILTVGTPEELYLSLVSPVPAVNLLGMDMIHRATESPADVSILAGMTAVAAEFIHRWLASPDVGVGEKGVQVLGDLLDVDCPRPPPPRPNSYERRTEAGNGDLWRLIFQTKEIFHLLISLCDGRHPDTMLMPDNTRGLSIAQGRLLRLLPRLAAMNFDAVVRSPLKFPVPVHATNGHSAPDRIVDFATRNGILQWAAMLMIDMDDVMMRYQLADFFERFVSLMRVTPDTPGKKEKIKELLFLACCNDDALKRALWSLPDRTVEEARTAVRLWLVEVMPVTLFAARTIEAAVRGPPPGPSGPSPGPSTGSPSGPSPNP